MQGGGGEEELELELGGGGGGDGELEFEDGFERSHSVASSTEPSPQLSVRGAPLLTAAQPVHMPSCSHAMPCHAMPCHAMPCHAMPCHECCMLQSD